MKNSTLRKYRCTMDLFIVRNKPMWAKDHEYIGFYEKNTLWLQSKHPNFVYEQIHPDLEKYFIDTRTEAQYKYSSMPEPKKIYDRLTDPAFFNTADETGKELLECEIAAEKQDEQVLFFFQAFKDKPFTARDVHNSLIRLGVMHKKTLLTSIRRSITSLTTIGKLKQLEERVKDLETNRNVRQWTLAEKDIKVKQVTLFEASCKEDHPTKFTKHLKPKEKKPVNDILESEEFYNLMQAYRHVHLIDQPRVLNAYEAIKSFLREHSDEIKRVSNSVICKINMRPENC